MFSSSIQQTHRIIDQAPRRKISKEDYRDQFDDRLHTQELLAGFLYYARLIRNPFSKTAYAHDYLVEVEKKTTPQSRVILPTLRECVTLSLLPVTSGGDVLTEAEDRVADTEGQIYNRGFAPVPLILKDGYFMPLIPDKNWSLGDNTPPEPGAEPPSGPPQPATTIYTDYMLTSPLL